MVYIIKIYLFYNDINKYKYIIKIILNIYKLINVIYIYNNIKEEKNDNNDTMNKVSINYFVFYN